VKAFRQLAALNARMVKHINWKCDRELKRGREESEITCFLLTGLGLPDTLREQALRPNEDDALVVAADAHRAAVHMATGIMGRPEYRAAQDARNRELARRMVAITEVIRFPHPAYVKVEP
jgi:hypothetical protein